MIILSLLSLLLNFSPTTPVADIACNQLIEAISDQKTGVITYCNRYKLPVVDSNGKMMFDVGMQRKGSTSILSLTPAMDCKIVSGAQVTFTFTDKSQYKVLSNIDADETNVEIEINSELRTKMMTEKVLSIAFDGMKYPYNVILKPNQGRVVQDVINCLQH